MKIKALIIDDSKIMRRVVSEALTKTRLADFEFIEACDGEDAISKLNPKLIDIIFVDWNMPKMSGIDFVKQARAAGKTEKIPIIMVTSEKTLEKVEIALNSAGANEYICKPFTVEQMQQKLGKIISEIASNKESSKRFFSKLFNNF